MDLDIDTWLIGLGLGQYAATFRSNEIDGRLLRDLSGDDLKDMGITPLGHRKRLLEAISTLRAPANTSTGLPIAAALPTTGSSAERRQLTVMFCDLVASTALAARLDPEDFQQLIRTYHDAVATAVTPFEGHIAQFLGDGVLVYFGYPKAHEDDAARAVRAAVNIIKALGQRHGGGHSTSEGDIELQSRIGIATGTVVVGEIGSGTAANEFSASGETPILAARLQGLAKPAEIVIADETRKLLGESFALESLGGLGLKGFLTPIQAWRILGERVTSTRFEAQHMQGLVQFIGRDSEVTLLLERWALARDGEGQAVLLSGEAGIGKSRICQTLRDRLDREATGTMLLQCSPYFSSSALYPIAQHLERAAGLAAGDSLESRASKLEQMAGALSPASLGCLLRLLGLPDGDRPRPGGGSPQEEKVHTLEALIELLLYLCEQQPVLFLVEDAHWIDPSTEEFIAQVAQHIHKARILLLVTCRPEYSPSWSNASQLTRHSLNRLPNKQCVALVNALTAGKTLPPEVLIEILRKTDGIPLFIEELTKTVLTSGLLQDTPQGYRLHAPLSAIAIPATLQDSLMARLDRLAPAKEVAQIGAVIGREFGHRLIVEVLRPMARADLELALADLVRSELVFRRGTPPDATYTFKHALVRDTAYNSMLKSQRRLRHSQIAAALESQCHLATAQPELLAVHHQEGGNPRAALRYWQAAGDSAMARSAVREALTHYQAATALLAPVQGPSDCTDLELELRLKLGDAAIQAEGFTSVCAKDNYSRARKLAIALHRLDEHVLACSGITVSLNAEVQYGEAITLMECFAPDEIARLKPMSRVSRLARMGYPRMRRGELAEAQRNLSEARRELQNVTPEDRQPMAGVDTEVGVLIQLGQTLVCQGLLQSADACAREGLAIAEQRQHSNSRVWAHYLVGELSELQGHLNDAAENFSQATALAERYGLKAFGAMAKCGGGRALVAMGQVDSGTRLIREGYSQWRISGGRQVSTQFAAAAAEVLLDAGRKDEAIEYLLAGEDTLRETEEKYQAARLFCARGRLSEVDGDVTAAQALYRQAIEIAERQGALLFALRAATALAQLYQRQGRLDETRDVLQPIYERFSEGFDYPDLVRARAVLESGG